MIRTNMDPVLAFMKQHDIPESRENYLDVAYMGTPPDELDAEEEAAVPAQFQLEPPEEFE